MRKSSIIIPVILLTLGMLALNASAQAPNTILYQGHLTNADGTPITVATGVAFGIYADPTGGTALWGVSMDVTPDNKGIFTVELGPMPVSVFNGSKRYIGLKVGDDAEMTPRQLLTSAPYSIATATAPGVASSFRFGSTALTSSTTTLAVDSVTINCPTSGYVVLMVTGYFRQYHTSGSGIQWARAYLSTIRGNIDFNNFSTSAIPSAAGTGEYITPFSIIMTDEINAAGSVKYFLNANIWGTHPANDQIERHHLIATFYPTSYGSVISTKANIQIDPNSPDGVIRDEQK